MKGSLKKIFAIAAMGLALAGCESRIDKDRKADVASDIIQTSVTYCQPGPVNGSPADYSQRLRNILLDSYTADMDVLKQNNIVVCLDQRLTDQNLGWLDTRMEGVYYNNGGKGGVLTLWDNGKPPSFWSRDASDWGSSLIHDFANQVRKGKIKASDAHWYAYEGSYTTSCGQNCTTTNYYVDWVKEQKFDKDTIRKNQAIVQAPPLKATAPARPGS
ncbi:MAG: hypothetical protein EPN97_12200 [Alphaproteobacteria bacterium]|nr:MAG: hypothetical protein EPN97_12200 [Alphaproteobacteria bacterium]